VSRQFHSANSPAVGLFSCKKRTLKVIFLINFKPM
jgi:hypothetical protein